jgi:Papain-like cysteine protease AvrRpt2
VIGAHESDAGIPEPRWDASVELELERQIGLNWCWAAVAKGIVDHYGGPTKKQCQYAMKFLGQKKGCCRVGRPRSTCDLPFAVDTVLAHYGVYAMPLHRPVALDTLRRELERDRPVVALIQYPDSRHALAITAVDVTNQVVGISDPAQNPRRRPITADVLRSSYYDEGRWCYTIFTRPQADARRRSIVSFLHDRVVRCEQPSFMPVSHGNRMEIPLYHADPYRLAEGNGLQTATRFKSREFRLDAFDTNRGELMLDEKVTAMRDEIEARLERGFEVRIVRCFAYKFEALWFTDPADISHRTDHYLPIPPVPYYLKEGREYRPAELRRALMKISPVVLRGIEADEKWLERLDRETAHQVDDGT